MKIKLGNTTVTERDLFNLVGVIFNLYTIILIAASIFSGVNYFPYAFITFFLSTTFHFFSEREDNKDTKKKK